jgi:hypothetical protein
MELLRERPAQHAEDYMHRRSLIVEECAPHPVMRAWRHLDRENRGQFPLLGLVYEGSDVYALDERLWLEPAQCLALLEELKRIRRVCRREEYLHGLDGHHYYERWREGASPVEFEFCVDRVEQLLERAVQEEYWVLMLH